MERAGIGRPGSTDKNLLAGAAEPDRTASNGSPVHLQDKEEP